MPSSTDKAKKNIRIDLLPSNRRLASKDCRFCIKRRIRCDRTIPQCQKCCIWGFSCPGFPLLQLRWDQGVASRGHLTGRKVPVLNQKKPIKSHTLDLSGHLKPSEASLSQGHHDARTNIYQNSLDAASLNLTSRELSHSFSEKLTQHFLANVAFRLTWLDGPSNPWRSLVLPLAKRSSCLRLSILGLAATHLSAVATEHDRSSMMEVNNRLRNKILGVLSQKIQLEIGKPLTASHAVPVDSSLVETLASMVVLCYGEMHILGSTDWKLHLRACRAVIERNNLLRLSQQPRDSALEFFIKEVIDLETFGNVSVFATDLTRRDYMSESAVSSSQPWIFTALINDITVAERLYHADNRATVLETARSSQVSMQQWHIKILGAYDKAMSMTTLQCPDKKLPISFQAIIEVHYHACLLYSYQALVPDAKETGQSQAIFKDLWQIIKSIANNSCHEFAHDLSFPLFIAGTECQTMEQRCQIESLFMRSISTTGFWCNYTVLQFLRLFWGQSDVEREKTWIQFARWNRDKINTFCVF
ncbi:hypothetical protein N7450_010691 [Penicillium hetheringtonii]|uniref:Zn(2)-C6 fungal-type domain-containing protein n=1 Tax=Penicillium hetheringtonii TaxID=911720 RepID=A0AAD6GMM5_9EURO|nr:hypothetical protein N7450_010691 [Penicillium hetheringtonii]